MSKWSSAVSKAGALALIAVLFLSACDRAGDGEDEPRERAATVVDADTDVDEVPQEEPGVSRRQWRTANSASRDIAGNLTVSLEEGRGGPLALAFANGITLRAEELALHEGGARTGSGASTFRSLLALPDGVRVRVYRVTDERVAQSAPSGGLCGEESRTTTLAIAEFVDDENGWVLRIAAFRGQPAPGARDGDPVLCGAFAYQQPR